MRLIKLGKRQFAFDLEWEDSFGDDPKEAAREALPEDGRGVFTVVKHDGSEILGYAAGDVKGNVYSYAEALAKVGRDGIYVAPADQGRYWYAIINEGVLVPSTDRSFRELEAIEAISTLTRTFNLPIFCVDDLVPDAMPLDLAAVVAKAKVKPMKVIGKDANQLLGVALLLVVLGGIGAGGWYLFLRKPDPQLDAAALAEQQRAAYVSTAVNALSAVPINAEWAASAYRDSAMHFDPVISGWVLDGVSCKPDSCKATYSLPKDSVAFALTPVYNRFGKENVTLLPDQESLSVNMPVHSAVVQPATEVDVTSPRPARARLMDTVGRIGMRFASVSIDGKAKVETLNGQFNAPPDMPTLYRDTLATKHASALDLVMLRTLSSFMAESSFVATSLTYSRGLGAVPAAWRIEWVRVHGGEV